MEKLNLAEIYSVWQNNLIFRQEFKKDPLSALQKAGFEVGASDLEKITKTFKLSDEEFEKKINK